MSDFFKEHLPTYFITEKNLQADTEALDDIQQLTKK